jgi:nucleoside triphosphate diphosphatase
MNNQSHSDDIQKLLDIMAALRDRERGCPWDREQTFRSIAPYTVEEAYEVADAIERDAYFDLAEELGDLLFQVVYHARLAEEAKLFDFATVVAAICAKLIRRHPHVFSDARVGDAAEQSAVWEAHKREERTRSGQAGLLDGIPTALPALTRAAKLGARAAQVGFDWNTVAEVRRKVAEELAELDTALAGDDAEQVEQEIGDLLLSVASLGRHLGLDAETALRRANARFAARFARLERLLEARGESFEEHGAEALDALWEAAKAAERRGT